MDILHDSHDCRLDAESSRVIVLPLCFFAFAITFYLVSARHYAHLDAVELALEALVKGKSVRWLYVFAHWVFD